MFSDIENHWSKKCIVALAERNFVRGYPDGSFRPNAPVSRAEFAVLMCNIFRHTSAIQNPIPFQDVPKTHWAYQAIQTASARGFLAGYPDKTFKPDQLIPRVQAFIALAAQLKLKVPTNPAEILPKYFDDAATIPSYARNMMAAATVGFLVVSYPYPRQLQPIKSATRGEMAACLCQVLGIPQVVPPQYMAKSELFAIAPQFDNAQEFREGLAPACIGQKWGFIDKTANFKIPPQFIYVQGFSEDLAPVMIEGGSFGFIDKSGKWVIPPQFYIAWPFSEGLAPVYVQEKWGYIDKMGQLAIAPQFDEVSAFINGLAQVRLGDRRGAIDKTGQFVNPDTSGTQASLPEIRRSQVGDLWGYIDPAEKFILQPQFDEASEFSEGLAAVRVGGEWIVEGRGNNGSGFPAEFVRVLTGGKWGYIKNPLQ